MEGTGYKTDRSWDTQQTAQKPEKDSIDFQSHSGPSNCQKEATANKIMLI